MVMYYISLSHLPLRACYLVHGTNFVVSKRQLRGPRVSNRSVIATRSMKHGVDPVERRGSSWVHLTEIEFDLNSSRDQGTGEIIFSS